MSTQTEGQISWGLEVAQTILGQISNGVKMCLGYHQPMLTSRIINGEKQYGVTFKASILHFTKSGTRGRPRIMRVSIYLNGLDYYDVEVGWLRGTEWVEHFATTNVDAFSLNNLMLSLDSDGPTATNSAYWPN